MAVTEREWRDGRLVRELWQNGGSSSAEYVETGEPAHVYAVESLDLLEPLLGSMNRILVLGGAALTLPVAFQEAHAELRSGTRDPRGAEEAWLRIDVVEIDPAVTRLAREYFEYGVRPRPAIHVIHDDARLFLRSSEAEYDLVYLDVFDHLVTVPWTMVTREALSDMAARLAPGGVFMANVLSPLAGDGTAFLRHFRATLESVFGEVHLVIADPELDPEVTQNLLVVASVEPGTLPPLRRPEASAAGEAAPLTDTWAPVEYLQAQVFLEGLRWR